MQKHAEVVQEYAEAVQEYAEVVQEHAEGVQQYDAQGIYLVVFLHPEVSPAPEFREISRIREFSENSTENSTEFLCYFKTDTLA